MKWTLAGLVLLVGFAFLSGCGQRKGSYTFEMTLDETLDQYVHAVKRPHLDLTVDPPAGIKGMEGLEASRIWFSSLVLGNYHECYALAVVDGPEGMRVVLDQNLDRDFSNDAAYPFDPYSEGSPYYLSDTLVIHYNVDTGGESCTVERKIYFIAKWSEEDRWVRYEFIGHRVGRFDHLDGEPFGFILFDADYNGYYDHRDVLVIDTNRDGVVDGNRNSVERYLMSEPFMLGDRPCRVLGINSRGVRLSLMPYDGSFVPRDRLEVGEEAPGFTLKDLSGNEVSLDQHAGKTILLSFWASGCGGCVAEFPQLVKIAAEYADQDVVLFTVTYDSDMEQLSAFLEKNGYDCLVAIDDRDSGTTGPLYQVGPIPTLFLIDSAGRITYKHVGYEPGDEEELRKEIEKALPRISCQSE